VSREAFGQLNRAVFYFFLTALTFNSVYTGDLSNISSPAPAIFCAAGAFIAYFLGTLLGRLIDKEGSKRSVITVSCFRTNTMIMGIPMAKMLFDDISPMVVVFAVVVPIYNAMTVPAFESGKIKGKKLLFAMVTNPIFISTLAGLAFNLLRIPLPKFVLSAVGTMATIGSGMAMVTLGASLSFAGFRESRMQIAVVCLMRLVLLPGAALALAAALGFRGVEIFAVLIAFGSAAATMTYTMAREMGGDADFAGEVVLFTHLFGFVTLFLWIFLLKTLNLM